MAPLTIKNEILMTTILNINNLGISFGFVECFKGFTTMVQAHKRIGLIGQNGSGKSSLLNVLAGTIEPTFGQIKFFPSLTKYMIPQLANTLQLSGGEAFQCHLRSALQISADLLLLDEPTNHLDQSAWQNLTNIVKYYPGVIIFACHDELFLTQIANQIWEIESGKVRVFDCGYQEVCELKRHEAQKQQEEQLFLLKQQRKLKQDIAFEQRRTAQSRKANMHENDRKLLQAYIQKGQKTMAKNNKRLNQKKEHLEDIRQSISILQTRTLRFHQQNDSAPRARDIVHISEGSCGYSQTTILSDIFLSLSVGEKIAITGDNGSGKSTLLKALLNDSNTWTQGYWHKPKQHEIGYLDQFYSIINPQLSVFGHLKSYTPDMDDRSIREHLNDYGFSKNYQVDSLGKNLSGGEKARLCLALLAAKTTKLLLLDEITNNLDLFTKNTVLDFLNVYPGSYIIICHDSAFLDKLDLNDFYVVRDQTVNYCKKY